MVARCVVWMEQFKFTEGGWEEMVRGEEGGGGGSVVEKTMMTSWCVGWGGEIRPIFHDCCSS